MKTDIEIAKFVRRKIEGTELAQAVSGKLSDRGRPKNSDKEDIVISILANEGCGQIQLAYVNVNVYVKDVYNNETKAWEEATIRIGELCGLSKFLFELRGGFWHTVPKHCSQRVAPTNTEFQDGHTEHFINNKLYIEIYNEDY